MSLTNTSGALRIGAMQCASTTTASYNDDHGAVATQRVSTSKVAGAAEFSGGNGVRQFKTGRSRQPLGVRRSTMHQKMGNFEPDSMA